MNPVVDTIVVILFVLFMIFIFQGYHQSKYVERHGDESKKNKDADTNNESDEDLSKK